MDKNREGGTLLLQIKKKKLYRKLFSLACNIFCFTTQIFRKIVIGSLLPKHDEQSEADIHSLEPTK